MQTRGAAGWDHLVMDGQDYLCCANFFTSNPRRQASMTTDSTIFKVSQNGDLSLQLTEVQGFKTTGAHGVSDVEAGGYHYLAVPNYYGGDTVVMRSASGVAPDGQKKPRRFSELQRLPTDGGGGVDVWHVGPRVFLGVAEFNLGIAVVYELSATSGLFVPYQRVPAPGCGALATLKVPAEGGGEQLLLLAASYVTQRTGWRTRSSVFFLNERGTALEMHQEVPTVGAHGVATLSAGGRHFVFFSNDKDERTTHQESELFEWVGVFPSGKLESRQKVKTDGAHAAEFFSTAEGGRHFLAVANLGDRQANTYRRDSLIYELDAKKTNDGEGALLTLVQKLPTLGATDFRAFYINGATYVAVSNEQDDTMGGDVKSTIWRLREDKNARGGGEL